jgi:hypothetical protein
MKGLLVEPWSNVTHVVQERFNTLSSKKKKKQQKKPQVIAHFNRYVNIAVTGNCEKKTVRHLGL